MTPVWNTVEEAVAAILNPKQARKTCEEDYSEFGLGREGKYTDGELLLCYSGTEERTVISLDLRSSFDKPSKSPIHFSVPTPERKSRRVLQAISYLKSNQAIAGTFIGSMPRFDDVSRESI